MRSGCTGPFSHVISPMQVTNRRGTVVNFTTPFQGEHSFPDRWFRNIKKFSVKEDSCYTGGRVAVIVKIYYRSWWKPRRKIAFVQDERTALETDPHIKARVLIDKLKSSASRLESREVEGKRPNSSYRRMVKLAA